MAPQVICNNTLRGCEGTSTNSRTANFVYCIILAFEALEACPQRLISPSGTRADAASYTMRFLERFLVQTLRVLSHYSSICVVPKFTVECPPYVYIAWGRRFGGFVANQGLGHNKPLPVPFKQKNRQRFRKYINALPSRFHVRHSGRPCFNQIPKENPPHTSICLLLSNLREVLCHAMTSSLSSSI